MATAEQPPQPKLAEQTAAGPEKPTGIPQIPRHAYDLLARLGKRGQAAPTEQKRARQQPEAQPQIGPTETQTTIPRFSQGHYELLARLAGSQNPQTIAMLEKERRQQEGVPGVGTQLDITLPPETEQAAPPADAGANEPEFVELGRLVPRLVGATYARRHEDTLQAPTLEEPTAAAEAPPLAKEAYLQMLTEAREIFAGRPLTGVQTGMKIREKSMKEKGGYTGYIEELNAQVFKVWATLRHLPDERAAILRNWNADEQGLRQVIYKAQELFGDWDTPLPAPTLEEPVTPTLDPTKLTPGATFYTIDSETCTFKGYDKYGMLLASGGKLPYYPKYDATTKPPSEWVLVGNMSVKPGDVVYVEGQRRIVLAPSGSDYLVVGNDQDGSRDSIAYFAVGKVVPKEPSVQTPSAEFIQPVAQGAAATVATGREPEFVELGRLLPRSGGAVYAPDPDSPPPEVPQADEGVQTQLLALYDNPHFNFSHRRDLHSMAYPLEEQLSNTFGLTGEESTEAVMTLAARNRELRRTDFSNFSTIVHIINESVRNRSDDLLQQTLNQIPNISPDAPIRDAYNQWRAALEARRNSAADEHSEERRQLNQALAAASGDLQNAFEARMGFDRDAEQKASSDVLMGRYSLQAELQERRADPWIRARLPEALKTKNRAEIALLKMENAHMEKAAAFFTPLFQQAGISIIPSDGLVGHDPTLTKTAEATAAAAEKPPDHSPVIPRNESGGFREVTVGETLSPSDEVGRIEVVRLLADHGAVARVFEVTGVSGPHRDERFVMKALKKDLWGDPNVRERTAREYVILQKLKEKGAVVPRPYYYQETPPAIFMEKAKGKTLQHHLDEYETSHRGKVHGIPQALGLELAIPVLQTLQAAHEIGISSTDNVNMSEIFWDGDSIHYKAGQPIPAGSVTIVDWNVVNDLHSKPDITPQRDLTKFCNEWYKLLTGEVAYASLDPKLRRYDSWERLSPEVQELLLRGRDKTRPDRWQTANEVITEIQQILKDQEETMEMI